jgi:hypothetical protein
MIDFTPAAVVYDSMFVHYDNEGNVHLISNVKDAKLNNFKIDLNLVEDFLTGKRQCQKFKIEFFFNLSKGIVTAEEQVVANNQQPLYLIPATSSYQNEVTLEHGSYGWNIIVNDAVKDKLKIVKRLVFFVVEKDNPYHMYTHITVDTTDLQTGGASVKFTTPQEADLRLVSVVTQQKFNSYGIKDLA